jgi:hypothetical protein
MSAISQAEADALLALPKVFKGDEPLEFSMTTPMDYERVLLSNDRREEFILTIERGNRKRARLKYQTRARKIVVLARLDLDGPAHRNPPESPHRPNERLLCPHLHLYHEGFEDRIAYLISDVPDFIVTNSGNGLVWLEDFLKFCHVDGVPAIQTTV